MKTLLSFFAFVAILVVVMIPAPAMGQGLDAPTEPSEPVSWTPEGFEVIFPDQGIGFLFDATGPNKDYAAPDGFNHGFYGEVNPESTTFIVHLWGFPQPGGVPSSSSAWVTYERDLFGPFIGPNECFARMSIWDFTDGGFTTLFELPNGQGEGTDEFNFALPDTPEGNFAILIVTLVIKSGDSGCPMVLLFDQLLADCGVIVVANEGDPTELPTEFTLGSVYPNPFNPSTTVSFVLSEVGSVELAVYDALGRKVATLVDEVRAAGIHEVQFDADGLPPGVYLVRLAAGDAVRTSSIVLAR